MEAEYIVAHNVCVRHIAMRPSCLLALVGCLFILAALSDCLQVRKSVEHAFGDGEFVYGGELRGDFVPKVKKFWILVLFSDHDLNTSVKMLLHLSKAKELCHA
jgi:hypothetical protein